MNEDKPLGYISQQAYNQATYAREELTPTEPCQTCGKPVSLGNEYACINGEKAYCSFECFVERYEDRYDYQQELIKKIEKWQSELDEKDGEGFNWTFRFLNFIKQNP